MNKIKSHGKCVVLNENAKLEPVRCDSIHSTICSVNNSLLVKTENGGISEEKEPAKKGISKWSETMSHVPSNLLPTGDLIVLPQFLILAYL